MTTDRRRFIFAGPDRCTPARCTADVNSYKTRAPPGRERHVRDPSNGGRDAAIRIRLAPGTGTERIRPRRIRRAAAVENADISLELRPGFGRATPGLSTDEFSNSRKTIRFPLFPGVRRCPRRVRALFGWAEPLRPIVPDLARKSKPKPRSIPVSTEPGTRRTNDDSFEPIFFPVPRRFLVSFLPPRIRRYRSVTSEIVSGTRRIIPSVDRAGPHPAHVAVISQ